MDQDSETTRIYLAQNDDGANAGIFCLKAPNLRMLTESHPASHVVPELEPGRAELVIQGADTVVVAGCTTSGCVRATVVDALSHNFRPVVERDEIIAALEGR